MPTQHLRHVRALFISDVHLGTRGCQADLLLDFLRVHNAEAIYLVGDIVDGWQLSRAWHWPQSHNDVVQKLLRKVRKGTRVVYVPGNHDEFLREYLGTHFGGIELCRSAVHETAAGRRFLVMHGDEFDVVVRHADWFAPCGDWAYDAAVMLNRHLNTLRRRLGFPYWSLASWAKARVKRAAKFVDRFEEALAKAARQNGVDGVICGHIHCAAIHERLGLTYINCGDWVESCTALAEHHDGRFEIIRWTEMTRETDVGMRLRPRSQAA